MILRPVVRWALTTKFGAPLADWIMRQVYPVAIRSKGPEPVVAALRSGGLLGDIVADLVATAGGVEQYIPQNPLTHMLGADTKANADAVTALSTFIANSVRSLWYGCPVYGTIDAPVIMWPKGHGVQSAAFPLRRPLPPATGGPIAGSEPGHEAVAPRPPVAIGGKPANVAPTPTSMGSDKHPRY